MKRKTGYSSNPLAKESFMILNLIQFPALEVDYLNQLAGRATLIQITKLVMMN